MRVRALRNLQDSSIFTPRLHHGYWTAMFTAALATQAAFT